MIDRLILGCARLTGGASAGEATALVRAALDAGITHVDTAPSYGMGTAEAVVGQALRRFGGPVRVTAKLGSARPPFGLAYSWLRRAKRAIAGSRSSPWAHAEPPALHLAPASGHDFSRAAMAASLDLSHAALGRIDFLLLHDITASEVSAPLLTDLAALATSVGAQSGYASQCPWDVDLNQRFGGAAVAQYAMSPAWFEDAPAIPNVDPLFLHSIVKAGASLRMASPEFSVRLDRAARLLDPGDVDTLRIAALYVAAARAAPRARLLIASTHRARLLGVLQVLARAKGETAAEVAKALGVE